ncbi:Glycosyltransferase, catalytic subunit of cellulose synthase and poly-beta-1,6-N-acetylglucosamine synthase [Porphyromonadaceae bacterium KH3R12]|uniref:glycosyltransferase n=1 Tax=Proteiniphilum sp. TaxID=1926877 RepID=UPI00089980BE|nr:glycosyltransferase [Proteiniphilum sp.]MDY9917344.1 glycosyltransferase [Proteiniphilum sp.]SDZ81869.1 Glycosyltransferase, catalytic subunit of cellulose synthase and poly-beta-1,6-N-acetylglucosamine synthase [Porphyromonadaceae bacterium KH3R12]
MLSGTQKMDLLNSLFNQFTLTEWILGGILLLCFLIQLFFWLFIYRRPYSYQKKKGEPSIPDETLPAISVIVTSKNNAEELGRNLPSILEQDYPNFEVIVVNSGSTDDTDIVLKAAELKYPHLYHTYVPAEADGGINEKKLALTLGIKAAKYDFLLFTEAYCKPSSKHWIREFGKEFTQGKEVILGFSRLEIPKKTGLRGFMLYDNLIHHLKFLSMAILRKPFMGIGRNLAYKKELFFKNKGFSPVLNLEGGEDDIYINRIAPKKKTGVVLSQQGLTETGSVHHFSEWRTLKSRYLYSKQYYKGFSFRIFSLETFSKYLFYISLIGTIALGIVAGNHILTASALLFFVIRYVVQWRVTTLNSRLFNAGKYHLNLFFYDIFQPLNNTRFRRYAIKRNRARG